MLLSAFALSAVPGAVALARPAAVHAPAARDTAIVLRHIDHLYAETELGGERVGVLNIYSEAPDFRFAIEPREGYACVDDVARAMVLLASSPTLSPQRMDQLDKMTRFVLQMQADNGYFYNFIWGDGRINRTYRTSLAELNWWSLRALWGLEAAMLRLPADSPVAKRAKVAADRLVANLVRDLPGGTAMETFEGLSVPTWLPFGSGADAASTATLGLLAHYRRTGSAHTRTLLTALGEGMMRMAAGNGREFPYGAHLSWRNQWHAWGNAQAYALLRAGEVLGRKDFTESALAEVDNFYPYLLKHGMLASFSVRRTAKGIEAVEAAPYPQIAYGISPMVMASMEAYRVTGKPRYRATAQRLAGWFSGDNAAGHAIYDPASGRVLDGINGPRAANPNSGAESTVEGLLALRALNGTRLP
ncbi:hypothetical protein ACG3SL_08875 [Sphingomonas sp. CJ20]